MGSLAPAVRDGGAQLAYDPSNARVSSRALSDERGLSVGTSTLRGRNRKRWSAAVAEAHRRRAFGRGNSHAAIVTRGARSGTLTRRHGGLLTAAVAAVLLIASGAHPPRARECRSRIADGVVWINDPAPDAESGEATPPFSLRLEQTFGAEEDPADELLAFVMGVAVDGQRRVHACPPL